MKKALREQIILDKALANQVTITPAQISQYFQKNHAAFDKPEQVQARHILVPDLATANKVKAALKSGPNFADVAKQYSTDPGSKDKGGELGLFRRGQMVPAFDAVAFSMPVNAISPPVKSPFGYHIIQVEAHQPGTKGHARELDRQDHGDAAPAAGSSADSAVPPEPAAEGQHPDHRSALQRSLPVAAAGRAAPATTGAAPLGRTDQVTRHRAALRRKGPGVRAGAFILRPRNARSHAGPHRGLGPGDPGC